MWKLIQHAPQIFSCGPLGFNPRRGLGAKLISWCKKTKQSFYAGGHLLANATWIHYICVKCLYFHFLRSFTLNMLCLH